MSTEYKLRIYDTAGSLLDEVTDFQELAYTKRVNHYGMGIAVLPGSHRVIDDLERQSPVEVWRRNQELELDWYRDYYGLLLGQHRHYRNDNELMVLYCPGAEWLLSSRHVLWYAGTTDRSRFISTASEAIMKQLVRYNAGFSATEANGRRRDGVIPNLTVETYITPTGETVNWYCAWANLLTTLQRLARIAGGDFSLYPTAPTAWEFRWHLGQLGTDRSATITFSLAFGNMANPEYRYLRHEEKTVAAVGGQGDESERDLVIVESDAYTVDGIDIETFVDAADIDKGDTDALDNRGEQRLDERRAIEEFSFDVLQTRAMAYGRDYFLGDLVSARWHNIDTVQKIIGVTVEVSTGGDHIEQIDVEMETQ